MDKQTQEKVFTQNKKLVYYVLNRYHGPREFMEDLSQIGMLALWEAISRYDTSKGELSTYAVNCIRHRLNSAVMGDYASYKSASGNDFKMISTILKYRGDLSAQEIYEICLDQIDNSITHDSFMYLYGLIVGVTNIENMGTYEDMKYEVPDDVNIEDDICNDDTLEYYMSMIDQVMANNFSERDKKLYREWLVAKSNGSALTMQAVADKYGITKQRVEQIIRKANDRVGAYITARERREGY